MDKLLDKIQRYKNIVIVSDDKSELMSKMVYDLVVKKFEEMREFYKKARMLTGSPKYQYFDMFFEDNHKSKYRKFLDKTYYVLRVKGNGYNIDGLGLQNSHPVFFKSDLVLTIKNNVCIILYDAYDNSNTYGKKIKREVDMDTYFRSYKVSKLLKNIDDGNTIT